MNSSRTLQLFDVARDELLSINAIKWPHAPFTIITCVFSSQCGSVEAMEAIEPMEAIAAGSNEMYMQTE